MAEVRLVQGHLEDPHGNILEGTPMFPRQQAARAASRPAGRANAEIANVVAAMVTSPQFLEELARAVAELNSEPAPAPFAPLSGDG